MLQVLDLADRFSFSAGAVIADRVAIDGVESLEGHLGNEKPKGPAKGVGEADVAERVVSGQLDDQPPFPMREAAGGGQVSELVPVQILVTPAC